jgi:hypothetical protein
VRRERALPCQRERPNIGSGVRAWTRALGTLVIGAPRKPGKPGISEHLLDRGDAEGMVPRLLQRITNVVDREVPLAERDDPIANRVLPRLRLGTTPCVLEEVPVHVSTKIRAHHPEGPVLVTKPPCGFRARETLDEERAERLVLALPRMRRFLEEPLGRCQSI